jgi:hypothetical protein
VTLRRPYTNLPDAGWVTGGEMPLTDAVRIFASSRP